MIQLSLADVFTPLCIQPLYIADALAAMHRGIRLRWYLHWVSVRQWCFINNNYDDVIIGGSASVVGTPPTLSMLHTNNGEETIRDS